MPMSDLASQVNLSTLEKLELRQRYFPPQLVPNVETLMRNHYGIDLPAKISPVQARLREITSSTGTTYCLELKGAKSGPPGEAIERLEVPLHLTKDLYDALAAFADDGVLEKTRYLLPGEIVDKAGVKHPVVAQIDVIHLACKKETGSKDQYAGSFATIDIELSDKTLLKRLRNGHHTFTFLQNGAVDLALQDLELAQSVSNSRLGRKGFDDKSRHAIDKLLKQAKKGKP
jgi:hypothetical protein